MCESSHERSFVHICHVVLIGGRVTGCYDVAVRRKLQCVKSFIKGKRKHPVKYIAARTVKFIKKNNSTGVRISVAIINSVFKPERSGEGGSDF